MKKTIPAIICMLGILFLQNAHAQAIKNNINPYTGIPNAVNQGNTTQTTTTVVQIDNIYDENTDPYGKYMSMRRDTFKYDANHLLKAEHVWASDSYDSILTDSCMHIYVYNASNKLICLSQMYWISNTSTYITNIRDSFTYDTKANTWTCTYFYWQGTSFQPVQQEIHQMNAKGQDTTLIFRQYLLQSNSTYKWETINRNYFTYNASGKLLRNMGYVWAPGGGSRQPASREDLIYNGAGQLVQKIDSIVNNGVSFIPEHRQYYYYNKTTGLLDSSLYQLYSQYNAHAFINWNLYLYKYSSKYTGYVAQMVEKQWDTGSSTWLDNFRHTYTYSSYTVNSSGLGPTEKPDIQVLLYPNPVADGKLHISFTDQGNHYPYHLIVSDISGKIVYQGSLLNMGNSIIPTQQLAPGMYNISLRGNNGEVVNRKFVKQ